MESGDNPWVSSGKPFLGTDSILMWEWSCEIPTFQEIYLEPGIMYSKRRTSKIRVEM
jgi:hypothetical protein